MSAVEVQPETIELLEFEPEIPCEMYLPAVCGPAGFVRCRACFRLCPTSVECWFHSVEWAEKSPTGVVCIGCKQRGHVRELFEFIPFGGTR